MKKILFFWLLNPLMVQASSSIGIAYGVRAIYPVTKRLSFMLSVSQSKYNNSILESPIITKDRINSVMAGVSFSF